MSIFTTQAIVLAKKPLFNETDRLYILYSENYGQLEAQVKAAALSSSKLAGSLEPVSLVEAMIIRGKRHETIGGVQLLKRFSYPDLFAWTLVSLAREVFVKLMRPGVIEKELYHKLFLYLEALEQPLSRLAQRTLALRFIWQMVAILGFGPVFDGYQKFDLSKASEKLLKWCLGPKDRGLPLDSSSSTRLARGLQVKDNLLQELEDFTQKYLKQLVEQDLYSFKFLNYA
ncbi:MAG: DNA repair protein RecO [Candidatus Komeilibacteria bacterium RIFCSPLOWO2_01_FULL_45_10]|uniref:DNA repair protein RecO n=1 Tax=Candidatus Komeilibacteria bacterium RIFCSPLOWO2_01_FULL_45_10 TaxID=1798550 RepID=A0A1G2BHQ0_9BACT|nr:MAG: DNA repair protein RecO [Candidatus Komeilibacteria bacterium RIFCSPLOWO2_01_FULL_45_10]